MGEDRIKGTGRQVSGSIKEAVGKVTGDTTVEAERSACSLGDELAIPLHAEDVAVLRCKLVT